MPIIYIPEELKVEDEEDLMLKIFLLVDIIIREYKIQHGPKRAVEVSPKSLKILEDLGQDFGFTVDGLMTVLLKVQDRETWQSNR